MDQPAGEFGAADERMSQVRAHVERQRAALATLDPGSPDARWVGQVVAAMERTLRHVPPDRRRIAGEAAGGPG